MADLLNGETMVGPKNDSQFGPAGTRKRSRQSLYMLVGGTADIYDVTVNFESVQGHWCQKESGARCHGNGNGKSRTYGKPSERDKHDPKHWCKHVGAALADVEGLAEAEERTARAFGELIKVIDPVVPIDSPQVPQPIEPPGLTPTGDARLRLAELEAERDQLVATIAADEANTLNRAIEKLIDTHGWDAVTEAVKYPVFGS